MLLEFMVRKLLEIEVHGESSFVLLLNGKNGSRIKLAPIELESIGRPIITSDLSISISEAPTLANAYTLGEAHSRTDLHGNILYALQFYKVPEKWVKYKQLINGVVVTVRMTEQEAQLMGKKIID